MALTTFSTSGVRPTTGTGSLSANDGATYVGCVCSKPGTLAHVNAALKNLVFNPLTNNDQNTSITVEIDDGDEDSSGPLTGTISLNVTAVNGEQPTGSNAFVTVDGCSTPRPDASNINYTSPQATPNAGITPVSAAGEVCVFARTATDLVIDAVGVIRPE